MKPEELEKYSSAVTLSDMEIFVFPELMYALVLANIMSPVIWRWRNEECFKKLEGKSSYRKLMRLKQFIIDEYEFNLDLDTWGLTRQDVELKRFENVISAEQIASSNALFGYQGDRYYFDVDIRRHFGLDKYDSEIIPYWKTETVEAMDAFVRKSGYTKKAGECVSLSALYAAAAFVVCGIPLEDIYMILTPLHSQNFIDIQDGVLTNNRRLVTRAMWFNGTAISNKAQRALRNESVTIVTHSSGYIHCLYDQATINEEAYRRFSEKLCSYLSTGLDLYMFVNFLRSQPVYQKYFQICQDCHGHSRFLKAETLFRYEHGSSYRIADSTHEKLLAEVLDEDFVSYELPGRIRCDKLERFIEKKKIDVRKPQGRQALLKVLRPVIPQAEQLVNELADFVHIKPRLPGAEKKYLKTVPIEIKPGQSREQIIENLHRLRAASTVADLAFYAYRDMHGCDWRPFVKAALERNPVSIEMTRSMSIDEVYNWLNELDNSSIYDGGRLAQPDEVANYKTGDGLEKAFLLANVIRSRQRSCDVKIIADGNEVAVEGQGRWRFTSTKGLVREVVISTDGKISISR